MFDFFRDRVMKCLKQIVCSCILLILLSGCRDDAEAAKRLQEALANGTTPCVTPEQAYVVSQILEGIYISAKTGEPYYFNK